jgi:hypothetical protein
VPRFLYSFHEMFSVLGMGTPENPGGDFGMYCWIHAPSARAALEWGHVLLGDYYKCRFARTHQASYYDGAPIQRGEIETDAEFIAELSSEYHIPECDIGHVPQWNAPWRLSNLDAKSDGV